ncbi:hypothetical protein LJ555_05060 [Lacticaseibacillus paracasei]|nr:hypothetical protein [Lacticaseibacillus paracasei]MCG4284799.1 hypothetical protein [Lacticaseibacillus paracasei]MCI0367808.1 hypothetical protein [Lacticaseibacillus paracasei]MCI0373976.1 hypothetical protein [Lacticaseibacillus paracasei]UNG79655.1 hypothetical protein LJ555_05060 [Lacticaseibacillus paracasei]
MCQAVNYI